MKKQFDKIVFEAESGTTLKLSVGPRGELVVKSVRLTDYSENYVNPPIPDGYKHVCGEWNTGFVIERISDGSQFVWIPVGFLDYDGTLDSEYFDEKFGRRNYMNNNFSKNRFYEKLEGELLEQFESVKKYGGFYLSRFNISLNERTGKPQSVKGVIPFVESICEKTKELARGMENSETVKSHLLFGAEYDSVLAWLLKSKAKTHKEIAEDSKKWGHYIDWHYKNDNYEELSETGSREEWCANNIYDFAGNVVEYTQETSRHYADEYDNIVRRGGSFMQFGFSSPVAERWVSSCFDFRDGDEYTGFRVALCIK